MSHDHKTTINQRIKHSDILQMGGVIKPKLLLRMAYKNLLYKRLRTTLTVMGVVIGIGSIVFLVSFGLGLEDLVSRQVVGSESVQTIDVTSPRSKVLKITPEATEEIKGYTGVDEVVKIYNSAGSIKYQNSQLDSVVYGVEPRYIDISSFNVISGNTKDKLGESIIVNSSLVRAIGIDDPSKAIDKTISVNYKIQPTSSKEKTVSKQLKIAAVIDGDSQAEVFTNSKIFEDEGVVNASQLKVIVNQEDLIPTARKAIESLGFTTDSPYDTLDQINQVFSLLQLVLIGFGGIGMIIAILGMFNTLTISMIERTREIGLLVTLGAQKRDVRRLFVAEALMLSVVGAVVGIIGAWLLGVLGNLALNRFAEQRGVTDNVTAFIIVPRMVIITILVSIVLGWLVVYYPARRASRINPVDALTNE